MKILIVNTFYYPEIEGGAEYSVKILAEKLKQYGHDVYVLCTYKHNCVDNVNGVTIYRFKSHCIYRMKDFAHQSPVKKKIHRLLDVYNIFNYHILEKYIREINPDIIHTNGIYDISPVIWQVSKKLGIPVVHTLRDYYLVCNNGNLLHRDDNKLCDHPSVICSLYRKFNISISKNVDFVTAPSEKTLNLITGFGLFRNSKKETVLNAANFNKALLSNIVSWRKHKKYEKFEFLYLGAFSEHKGLRWLIDSFKSINNENIYLILCGKGPLEDYVKKEAATNNHIIYRGFLKQDDIREVLRNTYMLVCPSLWDEPFGRVVLDAYQMDVPVIGTTYGALPSIIKDKITGIIVDPNDRNSLKNAICEAIGNSNLYDNMIKNIPDFVDEFSTEAQVEHFINIYESCINQKN